MSKRRRNLALLSALLWALPWSATAEEPITRRQPSDFQEFMEVRTDGSLAPHGAYAIPLEAEAVSKIVKDREFRLFDAAGKEIPSVLHAEPPRKEAVKRPVRVFNRAWEPGLVQTLTVELDDPPQEVNEFTFDIGEPEYHLQVQVLGSDGGNEWRIVADRRHLIRHVIPGEKISYEHNVIRIPDSRYKYYRFFFAESGRDRPLHVPQILVRQVVPRGRTLTVPATLTRWENPKDADQRHDYWRLDLGREHLGVTRLTLAFAGDDFARSASLWEWNDELDRPGRHLASTVIFRYGDDVNQTFTEFSTRSQHLVVMIDQGDDVPVEPRGANATRPAEEIRFITPPGTTLPLRVYFEPEQNRLPKYDLARRLHERSIDTFETLTHGPVVANTAFQEAPEPLSERVPFLLYIVVGVLVVILGWYIARTVKTGIPPDTPAAGAGE